MQENTAGKKKFVSEARIVQQESVLVTALLFVCRRIHRAERSSIKDEKNQENGGGISFDHRSGTGILSVRVRTDGKRDAGTGRSSGEGGCVWECAGLVSMRHCIFKSQVWGSMWGIQEVP